MNLRLQEVLAEVGVLWDQARTLCTTTRMEAGLVDDDLPSLAAFMATNARNLRALAELHNAMADRYDEAAQVLRR
jgi:hypothetical protein